MFIELPEQVVALRAAVKDFVDRELRPRVPEMEAKQDIDADLIAQMGELGYFGAPFEERWGGSDMGEIGFTIVTEEIARAHASMAVLVGASSGLAARMVAAFGSDEQGALPRADGTRRGAGGVRAHGTGRRERRARDVHDGRGRWR